MLSKDAAFFKEKVEIIYHREMSETIKQFQRFQKDVKDILTSLLLENEKLIGEVNRLNSLLEEKEDK